jgi:ABC-2 type transport system ATP-binding protein
MNDLSSPPSHGLVELDDLSVKIGRRTILDRLGASLSGRSIGLLGPNGAGKTTLVNTLMGFLPPAGGTARVFGLDVRREAKGIRERIGYMPENDAFIAGKSAVRFVTLMAELSGLPPAEALERAHEVLFYVGLGEARYRAMEGYSLGMKQAAKLAQAIVHGPRLVILDEPTNGLDPPARARMLRLIREIRDTGKVQLIVSSHILRDVEECCEEVIILKSGRLVAHRDLAEERRSNRKLLELEVSGDEKGFFAAVEELGCEWAPGRKRRVKVVLAEGVAVQDLYRAAAQRGVQIRHLAFKKDSLEEIFLRAMEDDHGGA